MPGSVVVIAGAGPGALEALGELLATLPSNPAALVFAALSHLHMTAAAAQIRLASISRWPVLLAQDEQVAAPGIVYFAGPGRHLILRGEQMVLEHSAQVQHRRPSADRLFCSAAYHGGRVIGVVLSGSGNDGIAGFQAIKAAGGLSMVQRPATAANPAMPVIAIVEDSPNFIGSPSELAAVLGIVLTGGPEHF